MVKKIVFVFIWSAIGLTACQKEKTYTYEVNDVTVEHDGSNKQNVKTTTEFISIVYNDIFGTTISQSLLGKLSTLYLSFGDKKMIEDLIIKNFLNQSGAQLPTDAEMRADINAFVKSCYNKFYNRDPDAMEEWQMVDMIKNDTTYTPELVYYTFLTSNEYRYY